MSDAWQQAADAVCQYDGPAILTRREAVNMNSIYFAYGSNMSAEQMSARCSGATARGAARLDDFRLAFDRRSNRWQGHVADIVEAPGRHVWGVLWDVTEAHLEALDTFEGVANGAYRRETLVVTGGGVTVPAIAYRVVHPAPEGAPSATYLHALVAGAEVHKLPAEYCAFLRGIAPATPGG